MAFMATGMRFTFDPDDCRASNRQITLLLEGLGYDQTTCALDRGSGLVMVWAVKLCAVPLEDNEHEVETIRRVIGQDVGITYSRLQATAELSYAAAG